MRLYEIPEQSKIYSDYISDGSSYIIFHYLDGMYSYCVTEKGGVINLSGSTPLKEKGDGYEIDYGQDKQENK